jgi:hypothetical protein
MISRMVLTQVTTLVATLNRDQHLIFEYDRDALSKTGCTIAQSLVNAIRKLVLWNLDNRTMVWN